MSTRDYGQRPYIEEEPDDSGFVEASRRQTWFNQMGIAPEPHSELLKPYDSPSYQEMEHFYPDPLYFDEWPDSIPPMDRTLIKDRGGGPGWPCDIFAIGNGGNRKCSRPAEVNFTVVSASEGRFNPRRWQVYAVSKTNRRLRVRINVLVDVRPQAFYPIRIFPAPGLTWRDYDFFDAGFESVDIAIVFHDPLGSYCEEIVTMYCEDVCCPSGDFEFDDASTPNTIAPGGNITVYVTGGCPPYSWGSAGTGYSWATGSTAVPYNTLTSAGGVCGVNYDALAEFVVTDACSDTVDVSGIYAIRNTGGTWTNVDDDTCNVAATDRTGQVADGDTRWRMEIADIFNVNTYGASCPKSPYAANNYCFPNNPCGVFANTYPQYMPTIWSSSGLGFVPPCCYRSTSNDCRYIHRTDGTCGVVGGNLYVLKRLYVDTWTC